jgi:hypothetical protein
MTTRYIAVRSLPIGIREALGSAHYTKPDVSLTDRDSVVPRGHAGTGLRGFCALVPDVASAEGINLRIGCYGGSNIHVGHAGPWDPDHAREPQPIPTSGAIITGTHGKYAAVYVTSTTMLAMLAPESPESAVVTDAMLEGRTAEARQIAGDGLASVANAAGLTIGQRWTLWAFKGLKPHARSGYLEKLQHATANVAGTPECVSELVELGYLKRSSNGATQITTAGKNANPIEAHHWFSKLGQLAEKAVQL